MRRDLLFHDIDLPAHVRQAFRQQLQLCLLHIAERVNRIVQLLDGECRVAFELCVKLLLLLPEPVQLLIHVRQHLRKDICLFTHG